MNNNYEKFYELFEDKELAKELLSIEKPEDAQDWLSGHGVEFTLDEVKEIGEFFAKIASREITKETLERISSGELSDDELAKVAGGWSYWPSDKKIFIDYIVEGAVYLYDTIVGWGW